MYFAGTQMHMVTFCIVVFELVMLLIQVIYFLERPDDKNRLRYLILLVFLLLYNICSGFFPDEALPIPITLQVIVAYLVGFLMSMYVIYYFYKVFDLKHLKFFVTYGLVLFLFVPFVFLYIVPLLLTGDRSLSRMLTVVIPFFYGLSFVVCATKALILKFRESKAKGTLLRDPLYEHAIVAYISMLCWAALPVIVFFGDFQILEHSVTNAGFLMMTIIYVNSSIRRARNEYDKLLKSEKGLQELNHVLQEKVIERTRKLEALNEQRTNTFINLAHETKTPLTLINNYLQEYTEKYGESEELSVIKYNVQRLTSDIVNFFDIERFNRGVKIYSHKDISNFSCLLSAKLKLFECMASKKKIKLEQRITDNITIKANAAALERIINNLVENAIKYTPEDGIVIVSLTDEGSEAIFSVSDSGAGIPEHYQKKVFEPYFQMDSSAKLNEGMGMGLAITKKVVLDLGGKIDLMSEETKGTTIVVSLRRNTEAVTEVCVTPSEVANAFAPSTHVQDIVLDSSRPFVLVVEDNLAMLNYLAHKLGAKYNVLVAKDGSEALQRIRAFEKVDLVISDIMMGHVDGFEFCKTLTNSEHFSHIPVIFLTAKSAAENRVKGLRLGAIDYIEKPFLMDHVFCKIDSILNSTRKQKLALIKSLSETSLPGRQSTDGGVLDTGLLLEDNCKRFGLTHRETEVIVLLARGLPYKIIADSLGISIKTVAAHVSNMFEKVGVSNKIELINKLNTPLRKSSTSASLK